MARPTALIAEDERVLREELRAHLATIWPELRIVAEADNGAQAARLFEDLAPDVVFLDIQMPGLTGLDVARRIVGRCRVVFVTAYDAHAVAAFEQGAVDYVLKPYAAERLALAVARVRERLDATQPDLERVLRELAGAVPSRRWLRWINASRGQEIVLITVDEVQYFQADTKYTRVVTEGTEALIRTPLKELQDELDPSLFWPIHRSTIVNANANAIAGVRRNFRGRLFVRLRGRDEMLAVSETHEPRFRTM